MQLNTSKKGKPLNLGTRYIGVSIGLVAFAALVGPAPSGKARASEYEDPFADRYSVNDFGGIGLMQTRTARFAPDGELQIGASFVNPYRRYFVTWQILPFMEATFRYLDPTNSAYGGPFDGQYFDQTDAQFFSDIFHLRNGNTRLGREADLKFKIFSEGTWRPAVAVGLQDFIGTSDFSGEYIVASKRFSRIDVSFGFGWGHLGNRGGISNPMRLFGKGFASRSGTGNLGGVAQVKRWFSGAEGGFFGGVEYFSDIKGLSFKLEYSGSDPEQEWDIAQSPNIHEDLPVHIGVNYKPTPWFDVSVGWERGNSFMLRGTLRANLQAPGLRKAKPRDPPVIVRQSMPIEDLSDLQEEADISPDYLEMDGDFLLPLGTSSVRLAGALQAVVQIDGTISEFSFNDLGISVQGSTTHQSIPSLDEIVDNLQVGPDAAYQRLTLLLRNSGFWAHAIKIVEDEATFFITRSPYFSMPKNAGRLARLVTHELPPSVEVITYVELISNFEVSRISIGRRDIEREAQGNGSAEDIWLGAEVQQPLIGLPSDENVRVNENTYPSRSWWVVPELQQHLGDPVEGIYLADVDLEVGVSYSPWPGLSFTAVGRQFLVGSLDGIKRQSDSVLPHVRSDLVRYLQGGQTTLSKLQVDYVGGLAPNWYFRAAGGIFEQMYGGVSSEVLYRPWGRSWALGMDVGWVKQRDYRQLLGFRNYSIVTGHASLYYDLPFYGLRSVVSAGRYLAGDRGVTFDISRKFDNGVRVGAFATFTNVSAADFGEGSFDKGFYIKIPMQLLLTRHSKQEAMFAFRPLTRDGGQRVGLGPSLFELVDRGSYSDTVRQWRDIGK